MVKINFNQVLLIAFVIALGSSMAIQNNQHRSLFQLYCDYTLNAYQSSVVVRVIREHDRVPNGFRLMTIHQGYRYLNQLKPLLGPWDIIKFDTGRILGTCYGSYIEPTNSVADCKFVIRG